MAGKKIKVGTSQSQSNKKASEIKEIMSTGKTDILPEDAFDKNKKKQNSSILAKNSNSSVYDEYTGLNSRKPVIVLSSEILPIKYPYFASTSNFEKKFNEGIIRYRAIESKKIAIHQTIKNATWTILSNTETRNFIQKQKEYFIDITSTQIESSKKILTSIYQSINSLSLESIKADKFVNFINNIHGIEIQSNDITKYSNSSFYLTYLNLLKRLILTHSWKSNINFIKRKIREKNVIISSEQNENIEINIRPYYNISSQDSVNPNILYGIDDTNNPALKKDNEFLDSFLVLNNYRKIDLPLTHKLINVATIDKSDGGVTNTIITQKIITTLRNNFSADIEQQPYNQLKRFSLFPLLSSVKSTKKITNTDNSFLILSLHMQKELIYSKNIKYIPQTDKNKLNQLGIDFSLEKQTANLDIWEKLIGEIQPKITNFTEQDKNTTNEYMSLSSLAKTIQTETIENETKEYRILSLESNDIKSISEDLEKITDGASYHIDSSISNNKFSIDDSLSFTHDVEKLNLLINKVKSCKKTLEKIKSLQSGWYGVGATHLYTEFSLSEWRSYLRNNLSDGNQTYSILDFDKLRLDFTAKGISLKNSFAFLATISKAHSDAFNSVTEFSRGQGLSLLKSIFSYLVDQIFTKRVSGYTNAWQTSKGFSQDNGAHIFNRDQRINKLFNQASFEGTVHSIPLALDVALMRSVGHTFYTPNIALNKNACYLTNHSTTIQCVSIDKAKESASKNYASTQFTKGQSILEEIFNPDKNELVAQVINLMYNFINSSDLFKKQITPTVLLSGEETNPNYYTVYSNSSASSMLWNYFLLISYILTGYNVFNIKFYDKQSAVNKSVYCSHGIFFGYDPKLIKKNYSFFWREGTNSMIRSSSSTREDFLVNSLGTEFGHIYDSIENLETFYNILINNCENLKSILEKPDDLMTKFFNNIQESAQSTCKQLNDSEQRNKLYKYLITNSVSQEQLILSQYISSEINDRLENSFKKSCQDIERNIVETIRGGHFEENFDVDGKIIDRFDLYPIDNSVGLYSHNFFMKLLLDDKFQSVFVDNRRILSIGLPSRMTRSLRQDSALLGKSGGDTNIIKISIYKKDLFCPDVEFNPKNFYFDSSLFSTSCLSHYDTIPIYNHQGANNLDHIINSIPFKKFRGKAQGDAEDYSFTFRILKNSVSGQPGVDQYISVAEYTKNKLIKIYKNKGISESIAVDIARNHSISFLLEEYINNFTKIDFKETRYYQYIPQEDIQKYTKEQFNNYLSTTNEKFDKDNLWPDESLNNLSSQDLNLIIENKKQVVKRCFMNETIFMDQNEIKNKIFLPKKFDRVFTLSVDPDEFSVKDPDNKNYNDYKDKGLLVSSIPGQNISDNTWKSKFRDKDSVYMDEYYVQVTAIL